MAMLTIIVDDDILSLATMVLDLGEDLCKIKRL